MTTLNLPLGEEDLAFVEAQAAKRGHADAVEYILAPIEEERKRIEDEAVLPLLREALESGPATPMTREDWEGMRDEARSRLAERVR